jgi:hypothetical protein
MPLNNSISSFDITSRINFSMRHINAEPSKLALQLLCGYAFARYDDGIYCIQPHSQIQMSMLKNCASQSRKLRFTMAAIKQSLVMMLMIYPAASAAAPVALVLFAWNFFSMMYAIAAFSVGKRF